MKQSGWMVNIAMRRVEPVVAKARSMDRSDYGCYQGPKRTYMLHNEQVFDTEELALRRLHARMTARRNEMAGKLRQYESELIHVWNTILHLEK